MNLSDPKLLELLRQMTKAAQACELSARLTGENFNVFKILDLQTAEVRTHSAFIAELLNPKGSHGQDASYLRLFVSQLGVETDMFDPQGATVKVEHHVDRVDNSEGTGGRMDIMLTDSHNRRILIENKINFGDLEKQLLRYHKFDKKAVLVYLTLYGKKPSEFSTGGPELEASLKEHGGRLTVMSYGTDILKWLDDCHRASASLPVVRESIVQYKHLICELTHQATGDKVKDEAKNLILAHPELADAVALLGEAWQALLRDANSKFEKQMNEKLPNKPLRLPNGITVLRTWHADEDGVWIGFRAIKGDVAANLPADADDARKYADVLKSLAPGSRVFPFWNVGVFFPEPFKSQQHFASLPKDKILSLLCTEMEMARFVDGLYEQATDITERLLAGITALPMPDKESPAAPQ